MNMPYFKAQPYDTDLRVPFMIRGPGIRSGRTLEQIGLNIDVAPTIAALLGTAPPPEAKIDGRSLVPLLFERTSAVGGAGEAQTQTEKEEADVPWRTDFLFEFWSGGRLGGPAARGPVRSLSVPHF
jgi:arylsulfatase A-like enzyme